MRTVGHPVGAAMTTLGVPVDSTDLVCSNSKDLVCCSGTECDWVVSRDLETVGKKSKIEAVFATLTEFEAPVFGVSDIHLVLLVVAENDFELLWINTEIVGGSDADSLNE